MGERQSKRVIDEFWSNQKTDKLRIALEIESQRYERVRMDLPLIDEQIRRTVGLPHSASPPAYTSRFHSNFNSYLSACIADWGFAI